MYNILVREDEELVSILVDDFFEAADQLFKEIVNKYAERFEVDVNWNQIGFSWHSPEFEVSVVLEQNPVIPVKYTDVNNVLGMLGF
jgi:hypothetical protein